MNRPTRMRLLMVFPLLVLACGILGCEQPLPRGKITGQLTYQGKAIQYGTVTFFGPDNLTYMADIEPDGSFAINEVPQGKLAVCVQQPPPRPQPRPQSLPRAGGLGSPESKDAARKESAPKEFPQPGPRLPAQFADAKTSGLTVDHTGPATTWTVDLK
ncbi:hypothetical protein [Tuwongella immobilis]|uniref:Carboxypeptidase regulatory-like domain-containing protein n=1 Tax=Tuwongella immobilis TaxID=692036 RepID=A0A6C2YK76_9BACT|nr:hypothetical protein [Tuwongella immobilis]VIP01978.1 unnamed protein product [Tuwongella immobilis]VTS00021.1 unnamed protein product [Tuwongella immobilis]